MSAARSRRLQVLIVDDDTRVLAAMSNLLHTESVETVTADSSTAARRRVAHARFDLALIDILLPGPADGLVLVADLVPRMPVIATSINPALRCAALAAGATAFAEKDGLTDDLLHLIHQTAHRTRIPENTP